jgi:hypothetical protein
MNRGVGESADAIWRELRAVRHRSPHVEFTPFTEPSDLNRRYRLRDRMWSLGKFPSQKENAARRRSRQSSPPLFELLLWLSASSAQARARSKRNLKRYRGPMATPEPKPTLVCCPAMTTVRLQRNRPSLVSLTASNRPPLLRLPPAPPLIGTVYFRESGDPSALAAVVVTWRLSSCSSMTKVNSLAASPVANFVFAVSSFHVPAKGKCARNVPGMHAERSRAASRP